MKKPNGYWTKERCIEIALKCENKFEFIRKYPGAYNSSLKNKWLNEIYIFLKDKPRKIFWTKEKCKEKTLECKTKKEFNQKYPNIYSLCRKKGWVDDVCSHMIEIKKKHNYWTFEKCKEKALICTSKSELQKLYPSAYDKASDNNWLDDICSHMERTGNLKRRCVYVAIFPDNYAYVGLTYKLHERIFSHINKNNSQIYKHIKENNLLPEFIQLTDYLNVDDVSNKLEEFYKTYYEGLGFNMLNIAKTGSIGANKSKYTKEICQNEALKYYTRNDFYKFSNKIYNAACRNNWINEICSHMIEIQKPKGYWTKEKCYEYAILCNTLKEFETKFFKAYSASRRHKWFKEITIHMKKPKPYNYKWTKNECQHEFSKYKNIEDFKIYSKFAYKAILNNNWLDILK
jgi:hypothetical protein